jgi:Cu+-exporting ATPase
MVASGKGAENGLIFRSAEALETAGKLRTIVVDKTGTLTRGQPEVTDFERLAGGVLPAATLLALTAALESRSEHPLAEAIVAYVQRQLANSYSQLAHTRSEVKGSELPAVESFEAVAGRGVQGSIGGQQVRVGTPRWFEELGINTATLRPLVERLEVAACSVAVVVVDGRLEGCFGVADPLKPTSAAAVAALRRLGLQVVMLSGDARRTAEVVAGQVGIDRVIAEVRPADKAAVVLQLQQRGEGPVAMVGDGLNDGPVLAGADVSFALGQAVPLAQAQSDFVLMGGQLGVLVSTLQRSRQTMRIVRQNLWWSAAYNATCVPLALMGWLPAWAAGLGMALSSLLVVLNALRLSQALPDSLQQPTLVLQPV